jgi:uncharacterized protein (UPF0276 family)
VAVAAVGAVGAAADNGGLVMTRIELGLGIGWRPQIARLIERRTDLGFVEIVAENVEPDRLPAALDALLQRSVRIVPHGISLSLGGAEPIEVDRVRRLAAVAKRVNAPLVSEHIAFVRAGGVEAGHLLPIARTTESLRVLVENVKIAQDLLPVPLALENISALFDWPDAEMSEVEFVREALAQTGALMLLDLSNVHANCRNLGGDPVEFVNSLPLDRLAYVHVGGGEQRGEVYYDTHAHPVSRESLQLAEQLAKLAPVPGYMIERDEGFPPTDELNRELDALAEAVKHGKSATLHERRSA